MRIISGKYKGKRILAPKNLVARPTTDMAKEALFNILNNYYVLDECTVLDLYAGTGNISYEFASRGAVSVISVDQDAKAVSFISKTARQLEFPIRPVKSEVKKFLKRTTDRFDIIFADPPYNFEEKKFEAIAGLVFERELLREDGILIIEHSKHTDLSNLEHFNESRRYGGSVFSFFSR